MPVPEDSRRARLSASASALWIAGLLVTASAHATVYTVTANDDMTFTPASITIRAGDTIAFENAGGVHNVHADNNRFICSVNCTTNNSPSALPWRVTVRFNQVGTFGYYCELHGDLTSGMRGIITVIDRIFVDGFDSSEP